MEGLHVTRTCTHLQCFHNMFAIRHYIPTFRIGRHGVNGNSCEACCEEPIAVIHSTFSSHRHFGVLATSILGYKTYKLGLEVSCKLLSSQSTCLHSR